MIPHDEEDDFLFGLASEPVPPVPVNLTTRVHDGVNRAITTEHLCDSVLCALPFAALELFQALCGGAIESVNEEKR
jgi:hypothetical protein